MKGFFAIVIDEIGIHARPASIVISSASKYKSELELVLLQEGKEEKDCRKANLKSVMQVLSLAVRYNARIKVTANGEDESEAIEELKTSMVKNGLIALKDIKDL